ncbi:MAG: hypothetical protein WC565_04525 [Parcubacteria group bacterium]
MGKSWFIAPKTVRLVVADGWIDVKERLTYREEQQFATAMLKMPSFKLRDAGDQEKIGNAEVSFDTTRSDAIRMLTWIVDWSAEQENPRTGAMERVPVTMEAIDQLDPELAAAIDEALTGHIAAMEARKNSLTGAPSPEAK